MASKEEAAATTIVLLLCKTPIPKNRPLWIKPSMARKHKYCACHSLLKELRLYDHRAYNNYFRMTEDKLVPKTFEYDCPISNQKRLLCADHLKKIGSDRSILCLLSILT